MGGTDLVAQTLRRDYSDLIADALVGLEVKSELRIVALDDNLGRLLDRLCANATHLVGDGSKCFAGIVMPCSSAASSEMLAQILVGSSAAKFP